ncbi:MAG: Omp28 family outer membrane lipoprotein [Prevotella sp.]|nr:Omp28 family outer membrane lipoprotein [Prevotella sp.]
MKKICLLGIIAMVAAACSNIEEDERYIYVQPAEVQRAVLIEDFTGQRCVNCPNATNAIHELQQQYGEENIIAVAIHSGPFAHRNTLTSPFLSDLGTTDGDNYYTHWGIEAQPGVKINRQSPIYDTSQYAAAVTSELKKTSPIDFDTIQAVVVDGNLKVLIRPSLPSENIDAKLQVWVVEDSINSGTPERKYAQYMPDGTTNTEYVHNHVYRASLTQDLYGDAVKFSAKEGFVVDAINYSLDVSSTWNLDNLSVVVFFWNETDGVLQAKRVKVVQ